MIKESKISRSITIVPFHLIFLFVLFLLGKMDCLESKIQKIKENVQAVPRIKILEGLQPQPFSSPKKSKWRIPKKLT